jgi:DivIVA domain-containing protein
MTERPGPDAVSAELIANRGFTVSRRGFEQEEVRAFLELVADAVRALKARSVELEADVASAREAAKNPDLDEDTLMRLVGEETGSILRSARAASVEMRSKAEAQSDELISRVGRETGELRTAAASETAALREAAASETAALRETAERETAELRETAERETAELRDRAEAEAARVVDEARQQAGDLRTEAEELLGRAEAEAEQASARIRAAAQETADQLVGRARREAEALHQQAEHDRRLTVEGAQAVREKILGDLTRRRRVAAIQIEQLRAGRERLLQSYAVVRRTLEEVNDELHRADAEAREAAADAGQRHEEGAEGDEVVLAAELTDDLPSLTVGEPEAIVDVGGEHAGEEQEGYGGPDGGVGVKDATAVADGAAAGSGGGVAVVDDVFARIRAGRQDAVSLDAEVADAEVADAEVADAEVADAEVADPRESQGGDGGPVADDELEPKRSDEEESWLQRRDSALDKTETALTRKLKRALQDEQNDLLDRLRLVRGRPTVAALLVAADEQKARYAAAASPLIERGAKEGTDFALLLLADMGSKVGPPGRPAQVEDLVTELTEGIVDPLRRRLAQTIEESGDDEQSVLVEALGAAYREWKTQRIERLAGDVLAGAFARGSVHGTPRQGTLRWVVDDVDGPCPDCDDNVLAGTLPRTEVFPTGQFHPPAHAGCRCIVVPGPG